MKDLDELTDIMNSLDPKLAAIIGQLAQACQKLDIRIQVLEGKSKKKN